MKILIAEDDLVVQELLAAVLRSDGFEVVGAVDAPTALRLLQSEGPDLAVLDVNLGDWSGFELLRDLRRVSRIPVIMLTARAAEEDVVRGFELGANDYVTKPFRYRELLARVRAQLRSGLSSSWGPTVGESAIEAGPLRLDAASHTAAWEGRALHLTPTEFRVLWCLMEHGNSVVPTRTLLKEGWGYDDPRAGPLVRAMIYRLRRKLVGTTAQSSDLLRTVPGIGVVLQITPKSTETPG